jgi:hypothetical protein
VNTGKTFIYITTTGAALGSTLLFATPALASSGHAASPGGTLWASEASANQGATFRLQTTCPEPWYSTRLESNLFASPVLLPARVSKLVSWTVAVAPKQRPGDYWISLNCFQLLTGRVGAADEVRVHVMGAVQRVVRRPRDQLSWPHRSR